MPRLPWIAALLIVTAACTAPSPSTGGAAGTATLDLDGTTYRIDDLEMVLEPGEEPWYRIEGSEAGRHEEDCLVGLGGGLGLYGDLPRSVGKAADLVGERLRVDFSGDGDDRNFCFAGMDGLAGAEEAWVTIESVTGDRVTFSMSGTFTIYDQQGGEIVKSATAKGTAVVRRES